MSTCVAFVGADPLPIAAAGLEACSLRPACNAAEPAHLSALPAVTLAPTQLDALDCVCLEYRVGWPLSAILPEVCRGVGGGQQGWGGEGRARNIGLR